MGREKTGRPQHTRYIDLEVGRPPLHIPANYIFRYMLDSTVMINLNTPVGKYGRSQYGRCRYGIIYGIYGVDKYGQCSYS